MCPFHQSFFQLQLKVCWNVYGPKSRLFCVVHCIMQSGMLPSTRLWMGWLTPACVCLDCEGASLEVARFEWGSLSSDMRTPTEWTYWGAESQLCAWTVVHSAVKAVLVQDICKCKDRVKSVCCAVSCGCEQWFWWSGLHQVVCEQWQEFGPTKAG